MCFIIYLIGLFFVCIWTNFIRISGGSPWVCYDVEGWTEFPRVGLGGVGVSSDFKEISKGLPWTS